MAKHYEILAKEQPTFSEEGKFLKADVIDQVYIRELMCLTEGKNWCILKIVLKFFILVNASVKMAKKSENPTFLSPGFWSFDFSSLLLLTEII